MITKKNVRSWDEFNPGYHAPQKMNPEIKQKWIEALRSGKYRQGEEWLYAKNPRGDERYCCLGILCVVNDIPFTSPDFDNYTVEDNWQFAPATYDGRHTLDKYFELPEQDHMAEYGLGENEYTYLAHLNDIGQSFNDIADWIEGNL